MKTAVVLFNLGGPDSLEAIEPFLFNLFSDRDIFKIPFGQKLFARFISRRRAPKVRTNYQAIGGKSPINEWTEWQRNTLFNVLQNEIQDIDVYTAMRYWHPIINDVATDIAKKKYEKIVLLPLYPHYSISTTGSSFNEWKRVYKDDTSRMIYINDYFKNEFYISAINERINETIQQFPEDARENIQFLFSAHGTPVSLVKKGDPYSEQIEKTVKGVMEARNFSHDHHLCFQSKVGPVKWLEPSTEDTIKKLAEKNKKNLLVIPISFVSDHIETLFELDIEYREIAEDNHIENYRVMKGLNDSMKYIEALKELVIEVLKKN